MRLDTSKLDLKNPRVHRKDLDFAVTWAKMYGKGRVFYSTLGHVEQNWDDPRNTKNVRRSHQMGHGLVTADVTPRHCSTQPNILASEARKNYKTRVAVTSMNTSAT